MFPYYGSVLKLDLMLNLINIYIVVTLHVMQKNSCSSLSYKVNNMFPSLNTPFPMMQQLQCFLLPITYNALGHTNFPVQYILCSSSEVSDKLDKKIHSCCSLKSTNQQPLQTRGKLFFGIKKA